MFDMGNFNVAFWNRGTRYNSLGTTGVGRSRGFALPGGIGLVLLIILLIVLFS